MKTLNEITIPAVNIPEHVVSVVPEDVLPSFEEMSIIWNQVLRDSGVTKQTEAFYDRVAADIKDTLSLRGYDITSLDDDNFYVKLDHLDEPESFEEAMEIVFP